MSSGWWTENGFGVAIAGLRNKTAGDGLRRQVLAHFHFGLHVNKDGRDGRVAGCLT